MRNQIGLNSVAAVESYCDAAELYFSRQKTVIQGISCFSSETMKSCDLGTTECSLPVRDTWVWRERTA